MDFSSLVDEEEMRRIAEERRVEQGRIGDSVRCGGVIGETHRERQRQRYIWDMMLGCMHECMHILLTPKCVMYICELA